MWLKPDGETGEKYEWVLEDRKHEVNVSTVTLGAAAMGSWSLCSFFVCHQISATTVQKLHRATLRLVGWISIWTSRSIGIFV